MSPIMCLSHLGQDGISGFNIAPQSGHVSCSFVGILRGIVVLLQ